MGRKSNGQLLEEARAKAVEEAARPARRSPDGVTRIVNSVTAEAHEALAANCEAIPGMEAANLAKYHFENPLLEYLYGPSGATVNSIATKWEIWATTLQRCLEARGYVGMREARTATVAIEKRAVYDSDAQVVLRDQHVANRCDQSDEITDIIMSKLRLDEVEGFNSNGDPVTRKMNGRDIKQLVEALTIANEQKSVALGMPTKLTGAFQNSNVTVNQIERIVYHDPDEKPFDRERLRELREARAAKMEAVEGEVVG